VAVIEPDSTYSPAFVWFARLIVAGLIVLFVVELIQGIKGFIRALRK
jgi:hypothetical protein